MATLGRTNQPQRSGPAGAADYEDIVTADDLAAGKTIPFVVKRFPVPVTIESLQNFELFSVGQFNGRKQGRHDADHDSIQPAWAIR